MSDKCFGDHTNRNIVKNPLLSTAVTGLSLDELTHKAVLLPVSPTLGLTARPEQTEPHNVTLGYTHQESLKSSGDAFTSPNKPITEPKKNVFDIQTASKFDTSHKITTTIQSKASAKSEDDFDVNEYIARLQGTRYVSAPLHSHLKEDQNANLDTTDENLEEINLNESQNVEVQQSLTADFKQNFSQLPTVLPHVANAVFNSFSNMLNLRSSRDQTPEVDNRYQRHDNSQATGLSYQGSGQMYPGNNDIHGQFQGGGVPFLAEEKQVKELAPPPREPPALTGPSNFRLPTKKKYAQIPGLSTGEAQAMPYNPPVQNVPPFFTPPSYGTNVGVTERGNISGTQFGQSGIQADQNVPSFFAPPTHGFASGVTGIENLSGTQSDQFQAPQGVASVFNPPSYEISIGFTENPSSTQANQNQSAFASRTQEFVTGVTGIESFSGTQPGAPFFFTPTTYGVDSAVTRPIRIGAQTGYAGNKTSQSITSFNTPPAYGTKMEATENENKIEASTKAQETKNIPSFFIPSTDGVDLSVEEKENIINIFIPSSESINIINPANIAENTNRTVKENKNIPVQQFVGIETPQVNAPIIPPPPMFSSLRRESATAANLGKAVLPPSVARRISASQPFIKPQNIPMTSMDNIFVPEIGKDLSQLQSIPFMPSESPAFQPSQALPQRFSTLSSTVPSSGPSFFSSSAEPPVQQHAIPSQPISSTAEPIESSSTLEIPTDITEASESRVPQLFTPAEKTVLPASIASSVFHSTSPLSNIHTPASQTSNIFNPLSQEPIEKPKPPIEPPKATGTNFRMTKKRPQYYSGPIEGVGSISNNIKPTIPMTTPSTNYHASLFTPEVIKPEEIPVDNSVPTLEAYSVPKDATFSPPAPAVTAFDISQPHQYTQDYNTTFDLSRATTDAYEEPKIEPKGFGIIGSLKSKLSSIDINKIQSSVTTFFDPAYNESKKAEASLGQNLPYEQGQTSFDLFVPSIQSQNQFQNQYEYQSGYGYNQYYQPNYSQNAPVNYLGNEPQITSTTNFPDLNYSQYVSEHSNTSYIPENTSFHAIENVNLYFDNSNTTTQVPPIMTRRISQEKHEKELDSASLILQQVEGAEIKTTEVSKTENVSKLPKPDVITTSDQNNITDDISRTKNIINPQHNYSDNAAAIFFNTQQTEYILGPTEISDDNDNLVLTSSSNMPPTSIFFDYPQTSKDFQGRDVNPDIVEDTLKQGSINPIQCLAESAYAATNTTNCFASQTTEIDDSLKSNTLEGATDIESDKQNEENYVFKNPPTFTSFENPQIDNEELNNQACNVTRKLSILAIGDEENSIKKPKYNLKDPAFPPYVQSDDRKHQGIKESTILHSITKDDNIPLLGVSTAPLFGLSAMLASKSKEIDSHKSLPTDHTPTILGANSNTSFFENVAETKIEQKDLTGLSITDVKNVLLIEPPQEDICAILKRNVSSNRLLTLNTENQSMQSKDEVAYNPKKSTFFDHLPSEEPENDHPIDPSELSICETCREVNSPVDKEVDFTSQLIENITSRILLSNAVEVPLTEKRVSDGAVENTAIDDQRAEITHITEDTIETLQAQSATELLDDAPNDNFGWTTESTYSTTLQSHDYSFNSGTQETYGFKQDSISENQQNIGFDSVFYNSTSLFFHNMPKNASDEIKAEFKTSKDDIIPARQMSIPSAPPAEEDSKSETGLDVHSIEQDATKDFPIEAEFVIEPSETDDGKIETRERKKTPELGDTFTNRVERFQKATDITEPTDFNAPISMASYFDTGNYAVESHFKNSLTSPNSLPITDLTKMPDLETHRNLSELLGEPYIPETSTQTRTTGTCTTVRSESGNQGLMTFAGAKSFLPPLTQTISSVGSRENMDLFNKTDKLSTSTEIIGPKAETDTLTTQTLSFNDNKDNLPPFTDALIGFKMQDKPIALIKDTPQTAKIQKSENVLPKSENVQLSDPMNFFSSTIDESKPETADFNRLASYFSASATKPDHSKSFFELSQSQNHYRNPVDEKFANPPPKPFFELSQSQNHYMDPTSKANIVNLMQDLTSPKNIQFQEQVVTTINYFTLELDNKTDKDNLRTDAKEMKELNITKTQNHTVKNTNSIEISNGDNKKHVNSSKNDNKTKLDSKITKKTVTDMKVKSLIINCRHCNVNSKEFKVRQCTNDTESSKDGVNPEMTTNVAKNPNTSDFESLNMNDNTQEGVTVLEETRSSEYTPVRHHWFYRVDVEDKSVWRGFSVCDSRALEEAFNSSDLSEETLVPTDGGRFDVNVVGRLRIAVYWQEKPTNVRRCSWFYKGTTDARYVPYTEPVADKLEEEYRHGITTGEWHRRLSLPNNEIVIMHGPSVMVHFLQGTTDAFSTPAIILLGKRVYRNPPKIKVAKDQPLHMDHLVFFVHGAGEYKRENATSRPRVVRRGHEECEIEEASPSGIDHLLLLCHGVGSACDMRFRSVEEVVEDFRATSLQLVQSHYKNSYDSGIVNRVEVLPISWHSQLHSGEAGVDRRLSRITLDSIPRLRAFTNHTVLDVLFYTSPVYHQTIIDTVCYELNRIYKLFKSRNPNFKGGVSLGGHSLGSVILYDLLCHQRPETPVECQPTAEKTYLPGITSNLPIDYPTLGFHPDALYALGSPIAIFECIRGVECLGLEFCLPTCRNLFNIFHPYDPIAYRIEPLINPQLQGTKPFLIPHHKGRKRMHLELKDTMVRVGADLKQKLLESLRSTWNKWKATPPNDGQLEKVVEEEMEKEQLCDEIKEDSQENIDMRNPSTLGRLNDGRRVDYVLQEAPLEMINEYLFAMSSHVGYWESEDTMLLILREIYSSLGVQPDCTVPQHTLTVHRTRELDEVAVLSAKEGPSTSRGAGVN